MESSIILCKRCWLLTSERVLFRGLGQRGAKERHWVTRPDAGGEGVDSLGKEHSAGVEKQVNS